MIQFENERRYGYAQSLDFTDVGMVAGGVGRWRVFAHCQAKHNSYTEYLHPHADAFFLYLFVEHSFYFAVRE